MQKINQELFQSPANAMYNAINQMMLSQLNTIITGKVEAVNIDGTYDVQPTLTYLNQGANPTVPPILPNIPATIKRFGNAAIKGTYSVGDAVLLGIVQRDISILKRAWQAITNPNSFRKFSLPDAIILDALSNSAPTTFIELKDGEINITATAIKINGALTINGQPYAEHTHSAGDYTAGGDPVTGTSGAIS
jgi:hypothetical protein